MAQENQEGKEDLGSYCGAVSDCKSFKWKSSWSSRRRCWSHSACAWGRHKSKPTNLVNVNSFCSNANLIRIVFCVSYPDHHETTYPIMVSIIVNLSVRIKTGSGLSLFSFQTCFCSCRHLNVNNGNIIMFFFSPNTIYFLAFNKRIGC